jgi:hypothetical protein
MKILNMLHNLRFFSSKCRLFHNAALFGFCIIHILNTGVLKFEKKFSRQRVNHFFNSPAHD